MSKKPDPAPEADPFQSIDPTALGTVSGGAGGGMDPTMMMMMMMMMGNRSAPPVVAAPANPYAGYTIDGVFYPFK